MLCRPPRRTVQVRLRGFHQLSQALSCRRLHRLATHFSQGYFHGGKGTDFDRERTRTQGGLDRLWRLRQRPPPENPLKFDASNQRRRRRHSAGGKPEIRKPKTETGTPCRLRPGPIRRSACPGKSTTPKASTTVKAESLPFKPGVSAR